MSNDQKRPYWDGLGRDALTGAGYALLAQALFTFGQIFFGRMMATDVSADRIAWPNVIGAWCVGALVLLPIGIIVGAINGLAVRILAAQRLKMDNSPDDSGQPSRMNLAILDTFLNRPKDKGTGT